MKIKIHTILVMISLAAILLSGCSGLIPGEASANTIQASGFISATTVGVASEIGGKVSEVSVAEGDTVQAGQMLFRVDDALLKAQYDQALAAVGAAQAALDTARVARTAAEAGRNSAQIQYEIALQGARAEDVERRAEAWNEPAHDDFELPSWYFQKDEQIRAMEIEVQNTKQDLETHTQNLEKELQDASNEDFIAAEKTLAEAQAALEIADLTLTMAQNAADREDLEDAAQEAYDGALADLEAAQLNYDRLLTTSAAEDVLEARALVSVARKRYDNAMDALLALQTGDQSLQLDAARAAIDQAQVAIDQAAAGEAQAEAALAQAQAALAVLEIQMERSTTYAPNNGVVMALNFEAGEIASPGVPLLTIADLSEVTLTVYIPEDQYGLIQLGQQVVVTADSFPGETFAGSVQHIADQAEFTPRNVQTANGRKATVYAIKILIPNPDGALKPGMPADASF